MTLLPARQRAFFAFVGVLVYLGLAVPEFVTAHRFCVVAVDPEVPYACIGPGLPALSNLIYWLLPAPFYLLYLSARLRRAMSIGAPWAEPRTAASIAGLFLAFVAFFVIWQHWPDWTMPRAPDDTATMAAWLILAAYMILLSTIRTERDFEAGAQLRAFPKLGLPVLASGLFFYAGVAVAEFLRMTIASAQCPPDSVCDMPGMMFMAFCSVIWLPGWAIFVPFLLTAADRAGIKPWPGIEARIGSAIVGLLLICLGVLSFLMDPRALPTGLFYSAFGAWFLGIQYLCGKAVGVAEPLGTSLPG